MQLPERYRNATFDTYRAEEPSQALALDEARHYTEHIRVRQDWRHRIRRRLGLEKREDWRGLYLVGPVGTGKTHLLAAMYHDLCPEVSCGFVHSSQLFRSREHPEAYARQIALRYRVLCLDEVEIDDAANEARLVHVLRQLDHLGVTLLATSNVEPEKFLTSVNGNDRFRRFLNEEFRHQHKVIFVGGDDYRRRMAKPGHAWIGNPAETRKHLDTAYAADRSRKQRIAFQDLITEATRTEHTRLVRRLADLEALYITDIHIDGTDNALRLLRIIDDLYMAPSAPVLYFTSEQPVEAWFDATARSGIEKAVAEKFARTTSRLGAMCRIERLQGTTS